MLLMQSAPLVLAEERPLNGRFIRPPGRDLGGARPRDRETSVVSCSRNSTINFLLDGEHVLKLDRKAGRPKGPRRRTFVVAGDQKQFAAYRQARGISGREMTYVAREEQLHGLDGSEGDLTIVLIGTYYDRPHWPGIRESIRFIPGATVRYDRLDFAPARERR